MRGIRDGYRRSLRCAGDRAGGTGHCRSPGPVYMRLLRGKVPLVLDKYDYQFELGKAKLLEDGNDVLIISSGLMTMRAGGGCCGPIISAWRSCTCRPSNRWMRKRLLNRRRSRAQVVTAENHTAVGGLGKRWPRC
ncbi:hypothetical protein J4733_09400 [Klebsiella pneumoniae]|uniref:Uncharacterized protein n=1 Tax=Klebsiella pneumoniae TaxID=573 RepID=A0A939NLD7_KLEPN|nr:hypothetical protein [Klebsiella pneumoniae]